MTEASPSLEITDPGLQSTIQDRGRRDVAKMGLSPAGFADWLSARAANRLLANPQGSALIETTMTGLAFVASHAMRIAVTGAPAKLTVSGGDRPMWQSVRVRAGSEVRLGATMRGLRCYIAFQGGIEAPPVFGSASTDLTAGIGGLGGRALARGDRVFVRPLERELPDDEVCVAPSARPFWREPALLRVLPGPQAARFSSDDVAFLEKQSYRVSPRSNRQGVRLEGAGLARSAGFDALSAGVCAGCVQLSSDGLPIVLLAEHQTTGGYAVPFVVITADIPDAAQLRPGGSVRFRPVTQAEAALALTEKGQALTEKLHHADPAS
jgi:antagonist of KipI